MIKFLIKFFLVAVLCAVSGCAFTEDSIAPRYNPPANLGTIDHAQTMPVAVQAEDGRASNKDRIGSKKNGYGIETARIVSSVDVAGLFKEAVEHEMASFGFLSGPGGLRVTVEVETFYNDFKNGFFSGDAVAEAGFDMTVVDADGSFIYAHSYKGIGMNKNIMMATGSQALPALQEALSNAMGKLVSDAGLQAALQRAAERHNAKALSGVANPPVPAG
jgi:uncharacterized lipoprotein YajG